jgi:C4-dicarboxylate transporter, DcuC family
VSLALCLLAVVVAFALIWRGHDVRVVLGGIALAMGAATGHTGAVFRKMAETLADAKFVLPICSAMGFAYVVRQTGCVEAMVRLLVRPVAHTPRLLLPASAAVALVVNMAIPSQTSTLAAVGPLVVALMARLGSLRAAAGAALVFGASIAGALLNPGLAEVNAVAALAEVPATRVVVPLVPGVLLAFAVGLGVLLIAARVRPGGDEPLALPADPVAPGVAAPLPAAYKALFPPLPVVVLLLGHPSLPWHDAAARLLPAGLEVFTVMLAGSVLTIALAAADRPRATLATLEGFGYAFAHVITIIAVSAGIAKALDLAGVLGTFVDAAAGNPAALLAVSFGLAFVLAVVSGSGTASSVALVGAIGPRAAELGVDSLALGGVILFGAEAGRTTSPVAAVLLFGSTLVAVPPRSLAVRLGLPCLCGGAAAAALHGWLYG